MNAILQVMGDKQMCEGIGYLMIQKSTKTKAKSSQRWSEYNLTEIDGFGIHGHSALHKVI